MHCPSKEGRHYFAAKVAKGESYYEELKKQKNGISISDTVRGSRLSIKRVVMNQNQNNEQRQKSLVHDFSNEILIDAWNGLKRRLGSKVEDFSLNEHELLRLVKTSRKITGTIEDNFLWTKEVIQEIKERLLNGKIKLSYNFKYKR